MDGFDDLLAPSRHALESNPFADDFHSGSPDPWASPFGTHTTHDAFGGSSAHEDPYSSAINPYASPTSHGFSEVETSPKQEESKPLTDPLDSATATQDDDEDNRPLGTLRSPGFRESIAPPALAEVAAIKAVDSALPSALLGRNSSPFAEEGGTSKAPVVSPPSVLQAQQSSRSSLSASGSDSRLVSPLEGTSSANALEGSLGGLSLGGDVLGGWHSSHDDGGAWGKTDLPPAPILTAAPTTYTQQTDDDSDDDKPINQTLKRVSQDDTHSTPPKPPKSDNGLQPVFVITVDDPQKVGDPIRPFTMYTVHTRTTSPLFQKSAFSVLRRYSDFVWLYEMLCHNNPGVVVPPVPEKSSFGRFEDQFVRQRRMALEKCIQKVANHPVLGKDPDLRLFLESDTFALDIKHRKAESPYENKGLIASLGQTLAGPRFHETDDWFDKQKSYLDSLESQLRGLAKAIELVARHRAELSAANAEFAQTVGDLSASDVGKQLSNALGELAEVERKAQELESTQSEQDMSTLMATVDEYARLINSVRAAFASRIRTYYSWKNAENDLLRTKQTHEKNRAQSRIPPDRLGYSLSQIAEAERRALEAKHEFDHVSKLAKSEVARFEQERIEDFKDSLHAFLEGMISRQKELISAWENYQQMLLKRVGGGGPSSTHPPVAAS